MAAKKLLILLVAALVSMSLASRGISAGTGDDIKGTVMKIDGAKITIKDFMGVEKTVEPINPEAVREYRVGDQATVKDGILLRKDGAQPPAPSPGSRY